MRLFIWYVLFFSFQKPGGTLKMQIKTSFLKYLSLESLWVGNISLSVIWSKSCIYWKARIDCFRDPKYMYDAPSHPRPLRY